MPAAVNDARLDPAQLPQKIQRSCRQARDELKLVTIARKLDLTLDLTCRLRELPLRETERSCNQEQDPVPSHRASGFDMPIAYARRGSGLDLPRASMCIRRR